MVRKCGDLDVRRQKDGKLGVEIRGVDVDDPTMGEIRSSSTDDMACWFVGADYDPPKSGQSKSPAEAARRRAARRVRVRK